MTTMFTRPRVLMLLSAILLCAANARAATEDLGNGFQHHGVATPVSNHRGTVATVDGEGRNVVLVWLFDCRGGYALLMIDAQTGDAQQYPMPFPPGGDCPYASILSSENKYYTHFNSHFVEFDPVRRAFTFFHKTARQMAMSMTEDDRGVIWSVTYPNCGLVSYDPKTGAFKDYGYQNKENWRQYPRHIAADDSGWIYFEVGSTKSQILAFDPATGKAREALPSTERAQGYGYVYRDVDGNVYGHHPGENNWYRLHAGNAVKIGQHDHLRIKPMITSSQGLFHQEFPDGSQLVRCDLVERTMTVKDAGAKKTRQVAFDYTSEGAHIMGVAAAPDGTLCGGTAFPMRFFSYDPVADRWLNRACHGQWNTVGRQGDHFFAGGYGGGFLLDWDPAQPWKPTVVGKECNPQFLTQSAPTINRPHKLLTHPDGKTLVLAGTPGYGYTGGGLLFWDRETKQRTLLKHTDLLPMHSTMSMVALPNRQLLCGTTTDAGTGGEKKAKQAELYILDLATKKLLWHAPVRPGAQEYTDLCAGPAGKVIGIADRSHLFVFDPETRKIVHQETISLKFGPTNSQQGRRVFVTDDRGAIYILFVKGIGRLDPRTYEVTLLAESPVPVGPGGDILNGRIYFASGSHLYSYAVPE